MTNKNSDIYHYYPKKVSLDYYLNIYYHQCEPKLPNIDINLINDTIKKIELTEYEKLLNKLNKLNN